MDESGVWRITGAFSRELKPLRARGEIFPLFFPPARDGMSLQHHVSADRKREASPFPSISHLMHHKPSCSDPIPRALPEVLLAHGFASLPCLPGTLLRKAHCLSCTSSRLETFAFLLPVTLAQMLDYSFCISLCSFLLSAGFVWLGLSAVTLPGGPGQSVEELGSAAGANEASGSGQAILLPCCCN